MIFVILIFDNVSDILL